MAEVRVIARSVARKGKEKRFRELLRGMPNRNVSYMNFMSAAVRASSISMRYRKAKPHSINTQQVLTLSTCNKRWGS